MSQQRVTDTCRYSGSEGSGGDGEPFKPPQMRQIQTILGLLNSFGTPSAHRAIYDSTSPIISRDKLSDVG